jgi:stearoyl-CoA desaturase (delta-9 desaturase)
MGLINVALFGLIPGALVLAAQIAWIPFWAAGVINGIGHYWGYRNWQTADASTNIVPFGILIGGEELHNNHHAFASSAKLSNKWYEFDLGWMYIRMLESIGFARVKKTPPRLRLGAVKPAIDLETLHAVIANRYEVLAKYAASLKATYAEEFARLKARAPQDAQVLKRVRRWLTRDDKKLAGVERAALEESLAKSTALQTAYRMRHELAALWNRSSATREQLVAQLQDWCHRAEASGIGPLRDFSMRLRSYA